MTRATFFEEDVLQASALTEAIKGASVGAVGGALSTGLYGWWMAAPVKETFRTAITKSGSFGICLIILKDSQLVCWVCIMPRPYLLQRCVVRTILSMRLLEDFSREHSWDSRVFF